jgi:hypothetical protein
VAPANNVPKENPTAEKTTSTATSTTLSTTVPAPTVSPASDTTGLIVKAAPVAADKELPPCANTAADTASNNAPDAHDAVQRCFVSHHAMLDNIYQHSLRGDHALAGEVALTLEVDSDGHITSATATVQKGHLTQDFVQQIADTVAAFRFSPTSNAHVIHQDLSFPLN